LLVSCHALEVSKKMHMFLTFSASDGIYEIFP
jgi:hypothetical protein